MDYSHLNTQHLGKQSHSPSEPESSILEAVPNPHSDLDYVTRFTCPEFTSICPVTGQPDFAHLVIDYIPDAYLVESKSLKLFLHSFRNHGAFHEDCTLFVAKSIIKIISPRWLCIGGYWYPRGGIPIDIFWQTSKPPENIYLPPHHVSSYRGRG